MSRRTTTSASSDNPKTLVPPTRRRDTKRRDAPEMIVMGILYLALLAIIIALGIASCISAAHAGIGVVGPDGQAMIVETPSREPEETLRRVLQSVRRANETDLPALLVAMEPILDHALVESVVNWDAYLVLHAAKRIDGGCLIIEGEQRLLWQGPLRLWGEVGPKSVENPDGWEKRDIVDGLKAMIRLERLYRRRWMKNLRPAPDPKSSTPSER